VESKRDKFKRLANIRVNNTLKVLDLIGNLSNSSNYDYSDEEIRKIFNSINSKIKDVQSKFKEKNNNKFNI
jgi:hypothetical protein